jgi:hypothetical protein
VVGAPLKSPRGHSSLPDRGAVLMTRGDLSAETIQAVDRAVSAWLSEHWSEIADGALPGIPELARHLRLIFHKP